MSLLMPAFGDPYAPSFDPVKPRELKRYFGDLEYLFSTFCIASTAQQKRYAVRYVDIDIADVWESLPQFLDNKSTFDEFKRAVFDLYPSACDDYRFSFTDLDSLVQTRLRTGIHTLDDLSAYHARFLEISHFLIAKKRLSDLEQMRLYPRAFSPEFWTKISTRLTLKRPDHFPDMPHTVSDVYAAAVFVLRALPSVQSHPSSPLPPQSSPSSSCADLDEFRAMLAAFAKTIVQAITSMSQPASTSQLRTRKKARVLKCKFCRDNHFIRQCASVYDYARLGKVIRNAESKVVLPTGAYVPEDTPGRFLKDKFDEWYRRHPQQLSTFALPPLPVVNAAATRNLVPSSATSHNAQYLADIDARIAEIEAELVSLRPQLVNVFASAPDVSSMSQKYTGVATAVVTPQIDLPRSRALVYRHSVVPAPQEVVQPLSVSVSSPALLTSPVAPRVLSRDPRSSQPSFCATNRAFIESEQVFVGPQRLQSVPSPHSLCLASRTRRTPDKVDPHGLNTLYPSPYTMSSVVVDSNVASASPSSSDAQYLVATDARIADIDTRLASLQSQVVCATQQAPVGPSESQTSPERHCTGVAPHAHLPHSRTAAHGTSISLAPLGVPQAMYSTSAPFALASVPLTFL